MADKEWTGVFSTELNERPMMEAMFTFLKKECHIPMASDFDMELVEAPNKRWDFSVSPNVEVETGGTHLAIHIAKRATEYRRSYEDVCHAAEDFAAGWRRCQRMHDKLAEEQAKKAGELRQARAERAYERKQKKLARESANSDYSW